MLEDKYFGKMKTYFEDGGIIAIKYNNIIRRK